MGCVGSKDDLLRLSRYEFRSAFSGLGAGSISGRDGFSGTRGYDPDFGFEIQSASVLNQSSNADSRNLPLEQIAYVRLMGLQTQHELGLTEVVSVDVLDQRLPDVRLDLGFQRVGGGKAEIIEDIAFGNMAGSIFLVCVFHFFGPSASAVSPYGEVIVG